MEINSLQRQIEYLNGLVIGLQAAVRGLITSHPSPEHAIEQVGLCIEDMLASGLASEHVSEIQLLGVNRTPPYLLPTQAQLDRARRS